MTCDALFIRCGYMPRISSSTSHSRIVQSPDSGLTTRLVCLPKSKVFRALRALLSCVAKKVSKEGHPVGPSSALRAADTQSDGAFPEGTSLCRPETSRIVHAALRVFAPPACRTSTGIEEHDHGQLLVMRFTLASKTDLFDQLARCLLPSFRRNEHVVHLVGITTSRRFGTLPGLFNLRRGQPGTCAGLDRILVFPGFGRTTGHGWTLPCAR